MQAAEDYVMSQGAKRLALNLFGPNRVARSFARINGLQGHGHRNENRPCLFCRSRITVGHRLVSVRGHRFHSQDLCLAR